MSDTPRGPDTELDYLCGKFTALHEEGVRVAGMIAHAAHQRAEFIKKAHPIVSQLMNYVNHDSPRVAVQHLADACIIINLEDESVTLVPLVVRK